MTNIIKKIMFKGWSRPDSFPREAIERFLDETPRVKRLSLKRHNKVCKRNHGQPHEFVKVGNTTLGMGYSWDEFKCSVCGKKDIQFHKNRGVV